jgi:hypothetical protein
VALSNRCPFHLACNWMLAVSDHLRLCEFGCTGDSLPYLLIAPGYLNFAGQDRNPCQTTRLWGYAGWIPNVRTVLQHTESTCDRKY